MKLLTILAASLALALAGCNRDNQAGAGGSTGAKSSSSSGQTPGGGASGGSSEGSTDKSSAPKRPASK